MSTDIMGAASGTAVLERSRTVPPLPRARGPLSAAVVAALWGTPDDPPDLPHRALADADPFGEDLQLALAVCYELHYRGFAHVDPDWEWQPELLRLRAALERRFTTGLRQRLPAESGPVTGTGSDGPEEHHSRQALEAALDELLIDPVHGEGLTHWLGDGTWWQMREYLAHRSIYHLKEADPHAWAIPRLHGPAKAALVAVEFDEFGGGRYERMHSRLFADLLDAAGLDPGYLHYAEHVPAPSFATVNLMSMFGLHRSMRGALIGHFAAAEISTAPSARRMVRALDRMGAPQACRLFFTEHVEADAVHEQVLRHDVVGDLLRHEPELTADVVFGIRATELTESHLADHVLGRWRAGETSLRFPLE